MSQTVPSGTADAGTSPSAAASDRTAVEETGRDGAGAKADADAARARRAAADFIMVEGVWARVWGCRVGARRGLIFRGGGTGGRKGRGYVHPELNLGTFSLSERFQQAIHCQISSEIHRLRTYLTRLRRRCVSSLESDIRQTCAVGSSRRRRARRGGSAPLGNEVERILRAQTRARSAW